GKGFIPHHPRSLADDGPAGDRLARNGDRRSADESPAKTPITPPRPGTTIPTSDWEPSTIRSPRGSSPAIVYPSLYSVSWRTIAPAGDVLPPRCVCSTGDVVGAGPSHA